MKVAFFTEVKIGDKGSGASYYRVYQYIPYLEKNGIYCDLFPSRPQKYHYYRNVNNKVKRRYLSYKHHISIIFNRIFDIIKAKKYDIIFLQRPLLTKGPPILERLLKKFNPNIVFDFDDAIYLNTKSTHEIIHLSKWVIVGNKYLKEYALKHNPNVTIIPTAIDTQRYKPKDKKDGSEIIIGWIGLASNFKYLKILEDVLKKIMHKYRNVYLKVVSDIFEELDLSLPNLLLEEWSFENEVSEVQRFDIGIMPLIDNEWTRGKCGGKALVCMACGIPVVISPVGVNKEIVQDEVNGFLADTEEEWFEKLSMLIEDKELRRRMGIMGRKTVEEKYSIEVNLPTLLDVFQRII